MNDPRATLEQSLQAALCLAQLDLKKFKVRPLQAKLDAAVTENKKLIQRQAALESDLLAAKQQIDMLEFKRLAGSAQ